MNIFPWQEEEETPEAEDSGIWLSVGDLMSGLLMFFALLFIAVSAQLVRYEEVIKTLPERIIASFQEKTRIYDKINKDEKTGDLSLPTEILFAEGSYKLKPEGKRFLDEFIPAFSEIIFNEKIVADRITSIIIEGHTSSKGTEKDNMELSFKRALAVGEYINSINFPYKQEFQQKILVAAKGEREAEQQFDSPTDRKVKIRFQFKRDYWLFHPGQN
ncbi:MAG: OmpA family protein [Geminocystis sp.]|nr:OmpA family protein [Geminocystis sp.]HIK36562.1 OmpA family protein [Geminocystis sp. M7585_C2015_104]MCS7147654.1 OmpA family protein [Geminocystis sp.]MCX8078050.1 OmpA family protein [Geminocystis sp.]MDW8117292.1 OmpA family protein [Geminocystis sp.]